MELLYWIAGIIAFLLLSTYALKKLFKVQTIAKIVSVAKTKRFIPFIERISRTKLWDYLADIGLVMGFGAIAVDYLAGRKKPWPKRLAIAIASMAMLFALFFLTYGLVFNVGEETIGLLLLFSASFAVGGIMCFMLISLLWNGLDIIAKIMIGKVPCPGIMPIIPGVKIPNVPDFLTPPLSVWVTFLIIMTIHEFSHGALMERSKLKIKSVGVLLAGLLPIGAFVEPDEKEMKKRPDRQQLRIYAIGPASNAYSMPVFFAIALIVSIAAAPAIEPAIDSMEGNIEFEAVIISEVIEDYDMCGIAIESPAKGEIEPGWILLEFNDVELNTFNDLKTAAAKPDQNVSMLFMTKNGAIIEKSLQKNRVGQIGITMAFEYVPGKEPTQEYLALVATIDGLRAFFWWLLLLSFALAGVNFLPMAPFDGGKIAKIMFLPYFGFMRMGKKDTEKLIGRLFLWIVMALLLINAIPLFL